MAASFEEVLVPAGESVDSPLRFFSETIPEDLQNYYSVYLNGTIIGVVESGDPPNQFVEWIRSSRRKNRMTELGISVDHYDRKILINTDAGRILIPLIPVKFILEEHHRQSFNEALVGVNMMLQSPESAGLAYDKLLDGGFIELYDQVMLSNAVVAFSIEDLLSRPTECTHLQIPGAHYGLITSLIASVMMTRGARASYSSNQWKQAIGQSVHNLFSKFLAEVNVLRCAQTPLVASAHGRIIGVDRYPFCQNVHVIFIALVDNQLDALVFNQAAVDRMAFTVNRVSYQSIIPNTPNASFGVPDFTTVFAPVAAPDAYAKLDRVLGTPTVLGQKFAKKDVIAAITRPMDQTTKSRIEGSSEKTYQLTDISVMMEDDHCPNDRHQTYSRLTASCNSFGQNDRMRILQFVMTRYFKSGDKLASEHAQKGISGSGWEEWRMPYNEDGIRPVIAFNAPAAIRRDTPCQIFFNSLGKVCASYGTFLDHTPFINRVDVGRVTKLLEAIGFNEDGTEKMYNGASGRAYIDPIFFGVMAYMREKRMVDDLLLYRYGGSREGFSRMPTKGRARSGGQSVDELTRNGAIASGASMMVRDCMFTRAAPAELQICQRCFQLAYPSATAPGLIQCDRCGILDPSVSHTVCVPYNVDLLSGIFTGAGCVLLTKTDSACQRVEQDPASIERLAESPSVTAFSSTELVGDPDYARVRR